MDNDGVVGLLHSLGACNDALLWIGTRSLQQAWDECPRADWMLWLVGRMIGKPGWPTHQQVVLVGCAIAETTLQYVPQGEDRPRLAIEAARAWADGTGSREAVAEAAEAAEAVAEAWVMKQHADIVRSMLRIGNE